MNKLEIQNDSVVLKVNPKVYPLDVVYSTAYTFLDTVYVLFDGDPDTEILVSLKPKNKGVDLQTLGSEFFNELINFGDYAKRAEKTKEIREALLQRALFTNDPTVVENIEDDFDSLLKELDDEDDAVLEDPDEIAVPWEEKYLNKETPSEK